MYKLYKNAFVQLLFYYSSMIFGIFNNCNANCYFWVYGIFYRDLNNKLNLTKM